MSWPESWKMCVNQFLQKNKHPALITIIGLLHSENLDLVCKMPPVGASAASITED